MINVTKKVQTIQNKIPVKIYTDSGPSSEFPIIGVVESKQFEFPTCSWRTDGTCSTNSKFNIENYDVDQKSFDLPSPPNWGEKDKTEEQLQYEIEEMKKPRDKQLKKIDEAVNEDQEQHVPFSIKMNVASNAGSVKVTNSLIKEQMMKVFRGIPSGNIDLKDKNIDWNKPIRYKFKSDNIGMKLLYFGTIPKKQFGHIVRISDGTLLAFNDKGDSIDGTYVIKNYEEEKPKKIIRRTIWIAMTKSPTANGGLNVEWFDTQQSAIKNSPRKTLIGTYAIDLEYTE